jgi:putative ABC transport system ATP-binding protein
LIFGEKIQHDSSTQKIINIRSEIGYLFQTPFLPVHLSVKEFIEVQASLTNVGIATAEKRTLELLKKFKIEQFAKKLPKQLSGGEKQRVALAAVLTKSIKLLLLDEPTGSLDFDNKTIIWDLISQLKSKDLSIVIVSHDDSIVDFADFSHKLDYGTIK